MSFILTLGCLFLIHIYNLCQLVGQSLKFEWNRLVSPKFEWTLKFERSPRIEGITLRSPRTECFTYFEGGHLPGYTTQSVRRVAAPKTCFVMALYLNSSSPNPPSPHPPPPHPHPHPTIFRCNFVNEKFCILIKISLKFVPKVRIDNNPALV